MSDFCSDVAKSRVQRVWFTMSTKEESLLNKVTFPLATDVVTPTGDVVVNQTTPTQDSLEKSNTLDVTNVHQGIADVATATVPLYIRAKDYANPIEGDKLLSALTGKVVVSDTVKAIVRAAILDSDDTITVDTVTGGKLGLRGVVALSGLTGTEDILYTEIEESATIAGQFTLKGCTRGYNGTGAKAFDEDDTVSYKSRMYLQDICRQDGTLWVQTDTLLKAVAGCRIASCSIPIEIGGAVMMSYTVNGKKMFSAGRSDLAAIASIGDSSFKVDDCRAFFVGQKVQNITKNDNNIGAGYSVIGIDTQTNTITVNPSLTVAWAIDDVISWWMPDSVPHLGVEIESRDNTIKIDGKSSLIKSGELTINTPVTPIQLVGDTFPGVMVDAVRDITATVSQVMMTDAAIKITEGFEGKETRIDYELGKKPGHKVAIVLPRAKLTTATETFQDPTVYLDSTARALGIVGEDSMQIILE